MAHRKDALELWSIKLDKYLLAAEYDFKAPNDELECIKLIRLLFKGSTDEWKDDYNLATIRNLKYLAKHITIREDEKQRLEIIIRRFCDFFECDFRPKKLSAGRK